MMPIRGDESPRPPGDAAKDGSVAKAGETGALRNGPEQYPEPQPQTGVRALARHPVIAAMRRVPER
jgi:hypothetical protein